MTDAESHWKRAVSRYRFWRRMIWISFAFVIVSPLLGYAGTVFGMIRSFDRIGLSGETDPSRLAEDISAALISSAIGIVLALPALILAIVSIVLSVRAGRRMSVAGNLRE